ncbi:MAG: LLM class F420-dependent oxidoreductase [Actinomycetota bacterium]|nr:LLM class F420-dependent oxidoreductase [Actinomycetota bacterium]
MKFGVHLPQYGRVASGEAIARAAGQAEDLGFDDVWVSDHLAVPAGAPYPPPFLHEPVVSLTWAAAATTSVGLGTSVLVLPYRHPLHLAKELASLDLFSGGRVVLGAAAGWLEGEFDALGVPFTERGRRTDEAVDALRACWEQRPVSFEGPTVALHDLDVLPQPDRRIPVWIGGHSAPALRRAVERGDGWHGTFLSAEDTVPLVQRLREARPEPEFTLSMRLARDGLRADHDELRREVEAFAEAGLQHLLLTPLQSALDPWLASVETLAGLLAPYRPT